MMIYYKKHFALYFMLFLAISFTGKAQVQLVINEVSQGYAGNQEYVELLVVGTSTCGGITTYDIRNYFIDDNNGTFATGAGTGIADGCIKLSNDPLWSNVPAGTLILVYNDADLNPDITGPDDFSTTDGNCVIQIPYSNCTYLEHNTTQPSIGTITYPGAVVACGSYNVVAMANGGDSFHTLDPTGTTVIHAVSWGNNTLNNIIYFAGGQGGLVCAMHNLINNNIANQSNWTSVAVSSTAQTPGYPNDAANAAWINSMNNSCTALSPLTTPTTFTNAGCTCTGAASVSASGAIGPYTYTWSPSGAHGTSISGLCSGTYTISVTSSNGCINTSTVGITGGSALSSVITSTNVNCNGSNTGIANIAVSGGSGSYTYTWSPSGGNSASASGLSAGNYTVSFHDGSGCTGSNTVAITQPATALTATANTTATISCNGGSTGSATVAVSGGTSGYTYTWSPSGGNTTTASGLSAGNYTVNITDSKGCITNKTVSITQPAALTATTSVTASVSCNGGSTGSASVAVSGGTAAYSYTWSPGGVTTSTVSSLSAGNYTVNIKDNNGCTATKTISIAQPAAALTATASITSTISCNGGSNGSASVAVSGGTVAYSYTWSPGGITTSTVAGLTAGNYTVNIKDNNGCITSQTVLITQPVSALTATASVTSTVSCNGGNTGSTSVSVSGGTAAYSYTWSPGGITTQTVSGLSAGNYTVNIKDNNGCTTSQTVSITQPASPISVSFTNAPTSCTGNGTVTAIGNGGVSPYTYSWNTGANTATLPGVSPGTYTVIVTDANLCTKTGTVSVSANSQPTVGVNSPIICNGDITILTGTGASTYTWSTSAITPSISVNPSSNTTFTVTGTAANGCTNMAVSSVTVNPKPTLTITISPGTICAGATSILTAGGASTYTWNTGSTANPLSVSPGTTTNYTVTGTSAIGCTNTATSAVTVNSLPTYSLTNSVYTICNGGSQMLSVSGAVTWTWTPTTNLTGVNTDTPTASPTTTTVYSVTGTNNNGCINPIPATVTVNVSPAPTLSLVANSYTICNGSSQTFTASGASTYTWIPTTTLNNPSVASPTATPTTTTIYTVSGTASGCAPSTPLTLTLTVNPLPTYSVSSNAFVICKGASQTFTASGASTYTWTPAASLNNPNISNPTATPTTTTVYSVTGTNANGCTNPIAETVTVSVNPMPTYSLSANSYTICSGGSQTFSVSGAVTWTWTPAATLTGANTATPTASPTATTIYSVTGTNNNGCTNPIPATVTVNVTAVPSLSLTANSYTICDGNSQTFAASGASTYTWTPNNTLTNPNTATPTAIPNTTTIYTVSGIASGCAPSSPLTLTLTINPLPTYSLSSNTFAICDGASQTFTVSGASTYTWTPATNLTGANTANPTASPTTTTVYSVTGTNANGCTNSIPVTVTVNVNPLPTYSLTGNVYTICNGGSQTFSVSGATSYTWTPSVTLDNPNIATPTASPTTTTVYSVTGTNGNGCMNPIPATVTVNLTTAPTLSLTANSFTICNGSSQTFSASGVSTYTWTPAITLNNPGIANPTANPTTTTVYTVNGTASGCAPSSPLTLTLTVNPLPILSLAGNSYSVCSGSSQTFTVSGANTYTWTPATTLTNPNTSNPTASPTITTTYSVTGTDANGCTNIVPDTVSLVINPLPTYSLTNNIYTICNGGSATFSVSGATSYTWTPSATLDNPNIATPTANPTITTTYSVIGTDGNTCTNPIPATVTVDVASAPSLTLALTSYSICNGSSQTFSVSGANTYTWSPGLPTLTGSNTANPTANPTTTTIYTVSGTASGCAPSAPLTLTLNINPLPILSLANNSYSVCNGSSQTFTVSGASTYTWTPSATLAGANTANPTATTNTTTTYSVTGTDGNGCISSAVDTVLLTVNTLPTLTLTAANSGTVCSGSSTMLTATGTGLANATYSWSTGSSTLTNTLSVTPVSTPENYSVTATNTVTGCSSATATTVVTISPTPSITVQDSNSASSSTICLNNSVNLTATGASTYTWTPATGLSPATGSVVNASPTNTNTPTVYTVTGTSAAGCLSNSASAGTFTVTVNPLPILSLAGNSYSVCNGVSQTFTVSGASNYTWTPSVTLINPNSATPTANTNTTTTYSVTGTDANGCSSVIPDTVRLTIYPLPTINVSAQTIAADTCGKGTGGVTNITVLPGTPPYTYNWYSISTGSLVSTSSSLSNVPNGSYSLEVTDANNCVATVTGGPDIFVVPTATVIASFYTNPANLTGTIPFPVSFTNTSTGATNYIWYFGDTTHAQSTNINPSFTYTNIGTYTVMLVAIHGTCTDTARTIVVTDAPTTIIIPNIFSPNGDGINDEFFIINTGLNSLNCLIYNRWGELLATLNSPNQVWDGRTPNGGNAPDGTYFYILQAQGTDGKVYKKNGPLTLVR